jgi:hypothetical protein
MGKIYSNQYQKIKLLLKIIFFYPEYSRRISTISLHGLKSLLTWQAFWLPPALLEKCPCRMHFETEVPPEADIFSGGKEYDVHDSAIPAGV